MADLAIAYYVHKENEKGEADPMMVCFTCASKMVSQNMIVTSLIVDLDVHPDVCQHCEEEIA